MLVFFFFKVNYVFMHLHCSVIAASLRGAQSNYGSNTKYQHGGSGPVWPPAYRPQCPESWREKAEGPVQEANRRNCWGNATFLPLGGGTSLLHLNGGDGVTVGEIITAWIYFTSPLTLCIQKALCQQFRKEVHIRNLPSLFKKQKIEKDIISSEELSLTDLFYPQSNAL